MCHIKRSVAYSGLLCAFIMHLAVARDLTLNARGWLKIVDEFSCVYH